MFRRAGKPAADRRPPRVLVLTPVFPPARGGIETLTEHIVRGLTGWPVEVVTLRERGSDDWDDSSGLVVHRAANEPRGGRRATAALNLLAVRRALVFRPDVVLSMYVRCAPAAQLLQRLGRARWVQYYHAKEVPDHPRASRRAAGGADVHIAVSRYTAALVRAAGADPSAVVVIPPAVSETGPQVRPRPEAASPHDPAAPALLSVSRLDDDYKGHRVVLAALPAILARHPRARWVVVGDGALRTELTRAAAEAGLADHVDFRGFVSAAERTQLLASSDVFVLPSRVPQGGRGGEGFGIVYIEAAAHGLPVVAGRAGGVTDAVEDADQVTDGGTGLLVDAADPEAVAGAVLRILADPELAERLRQRGPRWAENFAVERLLDRLDPLLRGRPPRPASAGPAGTDLG